MKSTNKYGLVTLAAAAVVTAASAGVSYNTHWGLSVGSDGQLVTENWQGGIGYLGESRLFTFNAQSAPVGGKFFDLGTNSVGGTFATPGVIGFDFLDQLRIFNGDGFDAVANTLTFAFGPATATSGVGEVSGFGTSVRDESTHPGNPGQWGRHHTHHDVFIDGTDPAAGVYLMSFRLWYQAGEGNPISYGNSETFWVLFNLNGSDADVLAAQSWVEANLIPAPGALALLGLAGLGGTRRRRQ